MHKTPPGALASLRSLLPVLPFRTAIPANPHLLALWLTVFCVGCQNAPRLGATAPALPVDEPLPSTTRSEIIEDVSVAVSPPASMGPADQLGPVLSSGDLLSLENILGNEIDRPSLVIEREIMSVLEGEASNLSQSQRGDVRDALLRARSEYGVEPLLVLALIKQESRFNPKAVGPAGSLGLMQLRQFVARDVAKRYGLAPVDRARLFDPGANVEIGTIFLAELIQRFGDATSALAAYNAGPTRVARLLARGKQPPRSFVDKVRGHYDTLHQFYGVRATGWGG